MIQNLVFDLGGVVITLDFEQAVRRFYDMGVKNIRTYLDPFAQSGIFGDLESGRISAEEFREQLSALAGCNLTPADCLHAWKGFVQSVPRCNLDTLVALRQKGFHLILLSNTNPYMMSWAMSPEFSGDGHALSDYFDACYLSYQCGIMKPDPAIFQLMLEKEQIKPSETLFLDDGLRNVEVAASLGIQTYQPREGEDWTERLRMLLE